MSNLSKSHTFYITSFLRAKAATAFSAS